MTPLREMLDRGRLAYHLPSYPGRLADAVLARRIAPIVLLWGALGAASIAAAASLLVVISRPGLTPATAVPSAPLVKGLPLWKPNLQLALPSVPGIEKLPALPDDVTFLPPLGRLVPEGVRDLFHTQGGTPAAAMMAGPQLPA